MGKKNRGSIFGTLGLLAILVSLLLPGPIGAAEDSRYFGVTGHYVKGEFLRFYDQYGGLDMFGYPRTEAFSENGRVVQYFQRQRMELWPENPDPFKVQLMLIGDVVLGPGDPKISDDQVPAKTDSSKRYYPETGHTIAHPFVGFFDKYGGLVFFGYPTSEQYTENGFLVQRFQRARLEWHPENPEPYKVQLGLLGDYYVFDQGKVERTLTVALPGIVPASQSSSTSPSIAAPGQPSGKLVFQTASGGDIFVINPDGTGLKRLTDGMDPTLSPDGRQVAFTRWVGEKGIYIVDVEGGEPRKIFDVNDAQSPRWSPDGKWIAFHYPRDGFTFKFSWTRRTFEPTEDVSYVVGAVKLADGSGYDFAGPPHSYSPGWSPDGRNVVFKGDRGLYIAGTEGSLKQIPNTDTRYTQPSWSPDGTKILFQYKQHDRWQVGVISPDGHGMHLLTTINPLGESPNNMSPTWSADGKYIAFASDREGAWYLYIMNADGTNVRKLSDVQLSKEWPNERTVAWSK